MFNTILIAGYGQMASALLEGWLAAGIEPERFTIYNPRPKQVPEGVAFITELPNAPFDAVVLGFKPHMLAEAGAPLNQSVIGQKTAVLSLLAGATVQTLSEAFTSAHGVVRFMPNLASALGKSPVALCSSDLGEEVRAATTALGEAAGKAVWLDDEGQFDLVTALAGSGPAFVYRFIDAIAGAAASLGLDRGQADALALQMVEGAASLAANSEASPGELADRVASPGGMTREGMNVLDDNRALESLLTRCLAETRDKGAQLAEKAAKKR